MIHIKKMLETFNQLCPEGKLGDVPYLKEYLFRQAFVGFNNLSTQEIEKLHLGIIETSLYSRVIINGEEIEIVPNPTPISQFLIHVDGQEKIFEMFNHITENLSVHDFVDSHDKTLNIEISQAGEIRYSFIDPPEVKDDFSRNAFNFSPYKYYNIFSADFHLQSKEYHDNYFQYLGYSTSKFLENHHFYQKSPEEQAEFLFTHVGVTSKIHNYVDSKFSLKLDFCNLTSELKQQDNFFLFLVANEIHNPELIRTMYSQPVMEKIQAISMDSISQVLQKDINFHIHSLSFFNNYRIHSKYSYSSESCDDLLIQKKNNLSYIDPIPTSIYNKSCLNTLNQIIEKNESGQNSHLLEDSFYILKDKNKLEEINIKKSHLDSYYELLNKGIHSLCVSYNVNDNPFHSPLLNFLSKCSDTKLSFLDKYIMTLTVIICFDEMDDEHHIQQLDSFLELLDTYMLGSDSNENKLKIIDTLNLDKDFIQKSKNDNHSQLELANLLFCKLESNSKISNLAEYKLLKNLKIVYLDQVLEKEIDKEISLTQPSQKPLKF